MVHGVTVQSLSKVSRGRSRQNVRTMGNRNRMARVLMTHRHLLMCEFILASFSSGGRWADTG